MSSIVSADEFDGNHNWEKMKMGQVKTLSKHLGIPIPFCEDITGDDSDRYIEELKEWWQRVVGIAKPFLKKKDLAGFLEYCKGRELNG